MESDERNVDTQLQHVNAQNIMTEFGGKWHPRTQDAHNEIKLDYFFHLCAGMQARVGQDRYRKNAR